MWYLQKKKMWYFLSIWILFSYIDVGHQKSIILPPGTQRTQNSPSLNPRDLYPGYNSVKHSTRIDSQINDLSGEDNSIPELGRPPTSSVVQVPSITKVGITSTNDFTRPSTNVGTRDYIMPEEFNIITPTWVKPMDVGENDEYEYVYEDDYDYEDENDKNGDDGEGESGVGISAWGEVASQPETSPDLALRFGGSNDEENDLSKVFKINFNGDSISKKRLSRNIKYLNEVDPSGGVVDNFPLGAVNNTTFPSPKNRYDVWYPQNAPLATHIAESGSHPHDAHRAPGYRPLEYFSPKEKNTVQADQNARYKRETNEEDTSAEYFDKTVDSLLLIVKNNLKTDGNDEVSIPDLHEKFSKWAISGHFKAWNGRLIGTDNLRRLGSVEIHKVDNIYFITCKLKFDVVSFVYNNYEAKLGRIGPTGKLKGRVEDNEILIKGDISILSENKCKFGVESVAVTKLDDPKIEITGLGPLNWLASKITSWFADHMQGRVKDSLSSQMEAAVKDAISVYVCDSSVVQALQDAATTKN